MHDVIRVGTIDVRFRVQSAQTAGGMTMFEFSVPAGSRVPVPHSHDAFDETIYGQEGVGTWTLDGQKVRVGAGDVLFIPRGHVHQFENLDNDEARMLSVITPGLLGPEYFHEMAAVINAGGPPDVEKLKEIMRKHGLRPAPPRAVSDVDVARRRLASQRLTGTPLATPVEAVRWLVAVQAQDYSGAKWGVGQRARNTTDETVERTVSDGTILRTHLLRPTWHFVTREDIRWLLFLTAPRVRAASAHMWRRLGMDAALFKRSHNALGKALRDGQQLTRDEIREVLERARVETRGVARMSYILMRAELDGIVCSGARRGKQFTYALLDDRAPKATVMDRDEALAQLAGRFFASRAPATAHDLAKWAGLTVSDAKRGFEAAGVKVEGELKSRARAPKATATAHLLSVYDEYVSSYKNRSFMCAPAVADQVKAMKNDLTHIVVVDSQVVGTWKRTLGKDPAIITINLLASVSREQQKAIATAAERYGKFFGVSHEVSIRRAR